MFRQLNLARWTGLVGALAFALPAAAAIIPVTQVGLTFSPSTVTAAPGDTVRWTWTSGSHTVTSGGGCTADGKFDALLDAAHPTFDYVVPTGVSEIPYFCKPHCAFGMIGKITVASSSVADFTITLDGDQEAPNPVDTPAKGTGTATLDVLTRLFSWNITFQDLKAAETAAHFHAPAVACATASPVITLPLGSPKVGSATLTEAQVADLLAGKWYVNIHTSAHPGGEIRGQVYPSPLADPIPAGVPTGDVRIDLQPVATGLTAPNWGTAPPGDKNRLFVTDQNGTVWMIQLGSGTRSMFLDLSGRLVALGVFGPDSFDERGLLGIAFHPDYFTNGRLYTFTSEPVSGPADYSTVPAGKTPNCQSVLAEWRVPDPTDPSAVVDMTTRRELLRIDKPQFNHNGGAIAFGPDGLLYVSLGDGGGADDKDGQVFIGEKIFGHGCSGNGQNLDVILGKQLRIDPLGTNGPNGQYGIPDDNPFVAQPGLDEIWTLGLRNPWRFSFDRLTGEMWLPDVGQNDIEEVNLGVKGGNYGWRHKEGSFWFVFNGNEPGYVTDQPLAGPTGLIDPIAQYDHDEGTAVVGGFVYRGTAVPGLAGKYVFGEFAQTFDNDGRLFYIEEEMEGMYELYEFQLTGQAELDLSLLGFGEDENGTIYVLANATGTPFGTTGVVLRVGPGRGDVNCDGKIDAFDIDPFVLALTNPSAYSTGFPNCHLEQADINGDTKVDAFDIDPFVALLTGG